MILLFACQPTLSSQGCFGPHADALVPGLLVTLGDKPVKNLQLKLEALGLVRLLISQSPEAFAKHLEALLPLVRGEDVVCGR